jgi:hypothetical protein
MREMRCVFNLEPFTLLFWKRFVVGYLHYNARNSIAKSLDDLVFLHAYVFDRVVQDRCDQHVNIVNAPCVREHVRNLERMVYIGFFFVAFSIVTGVTLCGKACRFY